MERYQYRVCKKDDIVYSKLGHRGHGKAQNTADSILAEKVWERVRANDSSFGEKTAACVVTKAMKLKSSVGIGLRCRNNKRKSNKRENVRPFLIPLFAELSATGVLAGGDTGVAKAINYAKAARSQLEESLRHKKAMEGLYLKRHKTGLGLHVKPYTARGLKKKILKRSRLKRGREGGYISSFSSFLLRKI